MKKGKCRLIFSLDFDNKKDFLDWINRTESLIDIYKVGAVPFVALGSEAIRILKDKGKKVFLDLKFFDIPNTMVKASLKAMELGVDIMDFHLSAGRDSLFKTAEQIKAGAKKANLNMPLLIGVTVLTSEIEKSKISDLTLSYSEIAQSAGFDGVVLSGRDAPLVRDSIGEDLKLICPGIRLESSEDDQKRVVTPQQIKDYADFIVVGRPIYMADSPEQVIKKIISDLD